MMIAKYLWLLGSLIILFLGTIHLFYTFFTNKFSPRKESIEEEMKATTPYLTRETTMWRGWIGFNASHSSGAMFIGIINFYVAVKYFSIFQTDHFFFLFNLFTIGFYVWLAKKYWFKIPLIGITITLICFFISYILTIMNR
jgi:hypothetical protein